MYTRFSQGRFKTTQGACEDVALLFRTSEERTLRLHASLPATR